MTVCYYFAKNGELYVVLRSECGRDYTRKCKCERSGFSFRFGGKNYFRSWSQVFMA